MNGSRVRDLLEASYPSIPAIALIRNSSWVVFLWLWMNAYSEPTSEPVLAEPETLLVNPSPTSCGLDRMKLLGRRWQWGSLRERPQPGHFPGRLTVHA
jgi:hypothetical protein